jgi:hypothetical protein
MRPVLEDNIGGDSPQMLEEAVCRAACDNGGSPREDPEISGGVECEGGILGVDRADQLPI